MNEPRPHDHTGWAAHRVEMDYAAYFQRGSLLSLARNREPYSFRETYDLLRKVYGYQLHYVNYGLWTEGNDTVEPAREMTLLLGRHLGLKPGHRVLEAGSGLGQAACDLARTHDLARVQGLNVNAAQLAFANDLAARSGLAEVVRHDQHDACAWPETRPAGSFDHAFAQECIGHFPDPVRFLAGLRALLPPGGRFAFTVVTRPKPAPRAFRMVTKQAFHAETWPVSRWSGLLEEAGFDVVAEDDITEPVFGRMFDWLEHTFDTNPDVLAFAPRPIQAFFRRLAHATRAGVDGGWMGYHLVVGQVPGA